MIKLIDLYDRIVETTGLDVMTLGSLRAAIANCMADLTSRGYKIFKEYHLKDLLNAELTYAWVEIENPTEIQLSSAEDFNPKKKYKEGDVVISKKHYSINMAGSWEKIKEPKPEHIIKAKRFISTKEYKNNDIVYIPVKISVYAPSGFKRNFILESNFLKVKLPTDIRKILYLRLYLSENATVAKRVNLTDSRIQCLYKNGSFRSKLNDWEAIYYTINDDIYIEWSDTFGKNIQELSFGYYQKLFLKEGFPVDANDIEDMATYELDIRPEFEDALVFYAAYFYYSRFVKDTDKINHYLSQYKYYIEDITHELGYEDEYNEEDAVIKLEED